MKGRDGNEASNDSGAPPGRRPRMRDVADAASVSLGTVSRVINGNRTVAEPIRQRVLAAAKSLGFVPDAVARSMRTQATRAVGCLVPDVANPLYAEIVGAAEEALHAASYNLVLANSRFRHGVELEILNLFKSRRLDGLIAAVTSDRDAETVAAIKGLSFPVVLIERDLSFAADSVVTDHHGGMQQATSYLLALGHTRIGVITAPEAILTGRQRAAGFRAAHASAGLSIDPSLTAYASFQHNEAYDTAYKMLLACPPPTAVLAGAAEMIGLLKAAHVLGLTVPDDLSVIALGDSPLGELHRPPLTAVRWDAARVGLVAAQMLLAKLSEEQREPRRLLLSTELLIRNSCAPPRSVRSADRPQR